MAKPETSQQAPGQAKLHTVRNADTGEERTVSQSEWKAQRAQLQQAGFERVDADDEAAEEADTAEGQ